MASASPRSSARARHSGSTSRRSRRRHEDATAEQVSGPSVDELRDVRTAYFDSATQPRARRQTSTTAYGDGASHGQPKDASKSLKHPSGKRRRHKTGSADGSSHARRHRDGLSLRDEYVYDSAHVRDETAQVSRSPQKKSRSRVNNEERSAKASPRTHKSKSVATEAAAVPADTPRPPGLRRSATTSQAKPAPSPRPKVSRRDTAGGETSKKDRDRNSMLGSLFRSASTPAEKPRARTVECLTCGSDDVPVGRSAKLACGHRMCNSCLKRIFTMSVKDPAHMPPRCCTAEHIPLKYVDHLFDLKFKVLWNRKYDEYTTKNRVYCPKPGCGAWIKPSQIHTEAGRKSGLCGRCKTKICVKCNRKWHKRRECPRDEQVEKLNEIAQENGWRRCRNCSRMIEKSEGCNHMTCVCTSEWCMVCGAKWKTCECPWFDYTQVQDGDRLNHVRNFIPMMRRHFFGEADQANGGDEGQPQAVQQPMQQPIRNDRNPALRYQQEVEMRRRQVERDEALARRLQFDALQGNEERRRAADQEVFGNAGQHFLNENFVQEATNVVMGVLEQAGIGRRGERESARRRAPANDMTRDAGLAPNAFGTDSVLGLAPPPQQQHQQTASARRPSLLRAGSNRTGENGGGDFFGRWLSRLG